MTEQASLLSLNKENNFYSSISQQRWLPSHVESRRFSTHRRTRSFRRRIFLILTEPDTSIWSAIFFCFLIMAIAASNIIMIMQTMDTFQFIPTDCVSCGGTISYMFEDDAFIEEEPPGVECVCPPSPVRWTNVTLNWLLYFLTVEWILRVFVYSPGDPAPTVFGRTMQWINFLTDSSTLLDALAIFPYYLERLPNGLVSLRIFRLFRIFQLVRLGQYNQAFTSLTNVMARSTQYLKLLMVVLAFGAAFFGSMLYWCEKGIWKFHEPSGEYMFVRIGLDGQSKEPTPFVSIPAAFWWFFVTATTVGYGDMYPTSTGGRYVAVLAMMMGVLVIAFPVSVFSELWDKELSQTKGFDHSCHDDPDNINSMSKDEAANDIDDEVVFTTDRTNDLSHQHNNLDKVVLDQADMVEVLNCLHGIRERELRIRLLLQQPTKSGPRVTITK